MVEPLAHPVGLARLLASNGLRLKDAHEALNALVNDRKVSVVLRPENRQGLLDELQDMRLRASVIEPAQAIVAR